VQNRKNGFFKINVALHEGKCARGCDVYDGYAHKREIEYIGRCCKNVGIMSRMTLFFKNPAWYPGTVLYAGVVADPVGYPKNFY